MVRPQAPGRSHHRALSGTDELSGVEGTEYRHSSDQMMAGSAAVNGAGSLFEVAADLLHLPPCPATGAHERENKAPQHRQWRWTGTSASRLYMPSPTCGIS